VVDTAFDEPVIVEMADHQRQQDQDQQPRHAPAEQRERHEQVGEPGKEREEVPIPHVLEAEDLQRQHVHDEQRRRLQLQEVAVRHQPLAEREALVEEELLVNFVAV
jgi:hypothetical protein